MNRELYEALKDEVIMMRMCVKERGDIFWFSKLKSASGFELETLRI